MSTPSSAQRYRFGPFELDSGTGELLKSGVTLKLQPQPFRLLLLFASRPGELVTREEIREALWSDGTTVEFDQSLNYCIRQIRAALGEDAQQPRFIETLPKRGYRSIAPIAPTPLVNGPRETAEPESKVALPKSRKALVWSIASAAIAATLFLFYLAGHRGNTPDTPRAILVRPFLNLGLPEEDVWFGDALTQQVIGALAETKTVHVVPWSSSLALKGQTASVRELGKRFHVDAILEGSMGLSGDRLRVAAQLVDVATERALWSHQDERNVRDLATVQGDIMNAVAGTLKLRLSEGAIPASQRRPQDLETYNLYLKALVLGDQFSRVGSPESIKNFEEVIRRAPDYAPAYAGLANVLTILPFFQTGPAKPILARARSVAERAIVLDPTLAVAHTALAHSLFNSWDWKDSEKEFQTAVSLDPDSAMTLQLYGLLLSSQGRADEAIRAARRAADLAPTSGLIAYSLSLILFNAGNFDEAIAQGRRTLELDRGFYQAYNVITRALTLKGMTSEALQTLNEWKRGEPHPMQPLWEAHQLAMSGYREQALGALSEWLKSNPKPSSPPLAFAAALLAAGQKDRALEAIRQSVEQHAPTMVWVKAAPELASIRSDPRFIAAVSHMKLD